MSYLPNSEELYQAARAFQTKKRLGQNFLVDADVLDLIVECLDLDKNDRLIEIGPGIGFLTRILSESGASISAVDLDRNCIEELDQLKLANVSLRHGDFLHYDLLQDKFTNYGNDHKQSSEEPKPFADQSLKVIGNVPYQITGLILHHLLGEIGEPAPWLNKIERIVLTVQKEVALRMVATAGSEHYSKVSLLVGYFCQSEFISTIKPSSFHPQPRVTSAIVKLTPHKSSPVDCPNLKLLRLVIKAGFIQRRKMLKNALAAMNLNVDIDAVFRERKIDPQARAENLSLKQFAMLTNALDERLKLNADPNSSLPSQA